MPFTLTILGSNSAAPTSERFSSAQLLKAGGEYLLLDCAEGTQIQLRRNHISLLKISHIFISHLHGDHFFGLIGLLTTLHLLGRKEQVNVYGPPLLQSIIDYQLEVTETSLQYPLVFHVVDPSKGALLFENKAITVRSLPLLHRLPTCGFLVREKLTPHCKLPVSYAYCTDTGYFEALAKEVAGVSCLFHEATFMEKDVRLARDKQHATAMDAARIADMAGVGQLIIGHFSSRYKDLSPLLEEAMGIFPRTELAEDSKTFIIENHSL